MAKRPAHHPPPVAAYSRPLNSSPDYIIGEHGGVVGFGSKLFYVVALPAKIARDIIIKNHYSGRVVNNSYVHLGVYLDNRLVGVLQFGYALSPRRCSHIVADTEVDQYLELNRMWLDDIAPRNSESRSISYAIKYIRRACPRVAWIQSFADERCGKAGVVYQAANFVYVGSHYTVFYELDGQTYHVMLLTAHKKSCQRGAYLRANLARATKHRLQQFRYIYFIRQNWRRRLLCKVQDYPKSEQML